MSECLMFGMDCEARNMTSVMGDEENVSFLVGTNNIKADNVVNKLYVDPEATRLMSKSYRHPAGEVRAISAHPHKSHVLATCSANYSSLNGEFALNIWNIDEDKRTLEKLSELKLDSLNYGLDWDQTTMKAVAIGAETVAIYDMSNEPKLDQSIKIDEEGSEIYSAKWSSHYEGNMLGLTIGKNVRCVDVRTPRDFLKVANAHSHRALSMDFNPNLQHVIATCGDDGYIRIWDTRSSKSALMSLHPHAHWVWQVKYHPVHDQLLLSVGSDACVVLSCAQSVSSEQNEQEEEVEDEEEMEKSMNIEKLSDGTLERIDEHEDSVYACAWSSADPWTFASLSYDGRMILSKVSRKHKYALMQL
ncbi:unnamed protein product [Caenorhabditis angaria]|uniref:EIPR1-like beta-propeller domain-containing protein n=1 Tax=Caenorhabditis angaria TaxID=860376 RepID=A0A9P1I7R5_9PELO|nr:unnamed protein product [Caenorhabditis angaria]